MLLLDRVVEIEENEIRTETKIDPNAFFLQGHYPDYPIVPGVIICECLFQSGAALLSSKRQGVNRGGYPVVARIENAKFKEPIFPGDLVSFTVKVKEQVGSAYYFRGEARVKDKLKTSVEFACMTAESKT